MAAKIVFIGAGSLGFTRSLVRDCLTFPTMQDAHIVLVDINRERLSMAKQSSASSRPVSTRRRSRPPPTAARPSRTPMPSLPPSSAVNWTSGSTTS